MKDSHSIIAYNIETMELIAEFESITQATRRLFIRDRSSIWYYIYGKRGRTFKGTRRGVASYKTNVKYHFEIKQK